MPAYLKTLYPCRGCGVDVQVRSRKESESAACADCRETARLERCVNSKDWFRKHHVEQARAAEDSCRRMAEYFNAAGAACEAAQYAIKAAARQSDIRNQRRLGKIAESRREWAEDLLRKLAAPLGEERDSWTGHLKLVALPPVEVGETAIIITPGASE